MGHPEGFCGYGSPDPAPVLPLLHALARLLLAELAWLGANHPPPRPDPLSRGCPCSYLASPPLLCALLP